MKAANEAALHSEPLYGDFRNLRWIGLSRADFDDPTCEHFGEGIVTVNHAQGAEGTGICRVQSLDFFRPELAVRQQAIDWHRPSPRDAIKPRRVIIAQELCGDLGNSKLFYRELGNLYRVFNAGLRNVENLLGNYSRYGVIALFEAKSSQCLLVGGD